MSKGIREAFRILDKLKASGLPIFDKNKMIVKRHRQQKSLKGRPVWEVIEILKVYKDFIEYGYTVMQTMNQLKKFCKDTGSEEVSKKMIEEYWTIVEKAYVLGFDFHKNMFMHFSIVRNYITKQTEAVNKKNEKAEKTKAKELDLKKEDRKMKSPEQDKAKGEDIEIVEPKKKEELQKKDKISPV